MLLDQIPRLVPRDRFQLAFPEMLCPERHMPLVLLTDRLAFSFLQKPQCCFVPRPRRPFAQLVFSPCFSLHSVVVFLRGFPVRCLSRLSNSVAARRGDIHVPRVTAFVE